MTSTDPSFVWNGLIALCRVVAGATIDTKLFRLMQIEIESGESGK